MNYIAFDVDGVLVDIDERLKVAKELSKISESENFWEIFFDESLMNLDRPRDVARELIKSKVGVYGVIIITGRPKKLYKQTINQLGLFYDLNPDKIYMRERYDRRPADTLKLELLGKAINEGFNIIEYHDDDELVLSRIKNTYPHITLYLHDKISYRVYWNGLRS
ncbi:MAG: hypothetical protein RMH77_02135 [Sulfolobales archaeon]|nr:hypothetical protein [Sulfolobales archaeon]MCX8185930.1 hypothetical protein [Sulfolobales archaeon]MDW7969187.1 hypothetical protein [Sulfolobales archaeon]